MEAQAYRLPSLVPRISGTGRSLLPTPNGADANRGPDKRERPGSGGPNLLAAVKMFPTPYGISQGDGEFGKAIRKTSASGGQLNADWVSILMGFPADWTVVEDGNAGCPERHETSPTESHGCDASETP